MTNSVHKNGSIIKNGLLFRPKVDAFVWSFEKKGVHKIGAGRPLPHSFFTICFLHKKFFLQETLKLLHLSIN